MSRIEPVHNIFEALGEPDAELLMAKAHLAGAISDTIHAQQLDVRETAQKVGCTQRRIKQFHSRYLDDFTLEELFDMLKALGQDVNITIRPAVESTAHLRVAGV